MPRLEDQESAVKSSEMSVTNSAHQIRTGPPPYPETVSSLKRKRVDSLTAVGPEIADSESDGEEIDFDENFDWVEDISLGDDEDVLADTGGLDATAIEETAAAGEDVNEEKEMLKKVETE
jgi:hypothetical protein